MSLLNPFDATVISFFNHFAHRSWAFDNFIELSSSYLFRVAGIVPLIWWAWFKDGDPPQDAEKALRDRQILLFGTVACLFSLAISRLLSVLLPFRERPLRDAALHFQLPYSQSPAVLIGWSSFPSDHASVYLVLAICLYFVSRRAGLFAIGWAILVTCLPRIYLGLHYPSDILAGAAIAVGVAYLAKVPAIRSAFTAPFMRWHARNPGQFCAVFFLYTLQLATAFEFLRQAGDFVLPVTRHVLNNWGR